MDSVEISRLFKDQKIMKKYIKKDYVRVYDGRTTGDHAVLTAHSLTDKLIDYSQGELILKGYAVSTTANPLVAANAISTQNGNYSILRDVKISFNNNEVEHNREPVFSTTYLNLLEYSPDYTESVAAQYGFGRDTNAAAAGAEYTKRVNLFRENLNAANQRPFILTISLAHISQFFRRLDFPIMNQLFSIEFNINSVYGLVRTGGQPARFVMTDVELHVPEVVLPSNETSMLVKEINSGNFMKEIEWDYADMFTRGNIAANTPFDILLGTNLVGLQKLIFAVLPNYENQEHNQTVTNVRITDLNIEIESKDFFNMNLRSNQEAYRQLVDCFNMSGKDMNTGSLLPIDIWNDSLKIYAIDLSRQPEFEADERVSQQIRIRGTPSAAGTLKVIMLRNKKTMINFSDPSKTRTIF